MHHTTVSVPNKSSWIIMVSFVGMLFGLISCGDAPNAGAVGTENAGRVFGSISLEKNSSPTGYSVRLISSGRGSNVVDSTWSDSSGSFRFGQKAPGSYWVEVWKNGQMRGSSSTFVVNGDVSGILVVLVQGVFQQELDLSSIGDVDSVFVDYPGNRGVKVGNHWLIQTTRDSAFVIHAHLGKDGGRWEEWVLTRQNGKDVFLNLSDSRAMDFQRVVDTGAFLLTSHTVALWNFDSLAGGNRILDRSANHYDLQFPSGISLIASPHGKALDQKSGIPGKVVTGDSLAPKLHLNRTGWITFELRLRMDSIPLAGMCVMGAANGTGIWITTSRQIVVDHLIAPPGQSPLWGEVVTEAAKAPIGKWFNLAVSVNASENQIFVWLDELAQPVFERMDWPSNATLQDGSKGNFEVGGADWDGRSSYFQLDEMRISDTLVFGDGYQKLTSTEVDQPSASVGEGVVLLKGTGSGTTCPTCTFVRLGLDPESKLVGAYAWKPILPAQVIGKRIVSAMLVGWDTTSQPVEQTQMYQLQRILSFWSPNDNYSSWTSQNPGSWNSKVEPKPFAVSPLKAGSRGGLIFDVTGLVQNWVDDTTTNHGVLIRAVEESLVGNTFLTAGQKDGEDNGLSLWIRYR